MHLMIAAVGRARGAPEESICENFLERARKLGSRLGFAKLELAVVDTGRGASVAERMKDEAARLDAHLPKNAYRIALDETGRALTSKAFAQKIAKIRDGGSGNLAFIIGGPDGLAPHYRDAANERLAFGPQTWPHLLVRAMLAEQIYRALTILSGHPYHRGAQHPSEAQK